MTNDFDIVPECRELLGVMKEARVRYEDAYREYDSLAEPLRGKTVVVFADEMSQIEAIESAAERATAAHNVWIEALKPWLACMKRNIPRR